MKNKDKNFSTIETHPKSITQWPKIGYIVWNKFLKYLISWNHFHEIFSWNKVKTDSITKSWVAPLFNAILTHKCADKWREIVNFCYSSKMHKSVFKTFFFPAEMTQYFHKKQYIILLHWNFLWRSMHGIF